MNSARLRTLISALAPFLGLAFIIFVFFAYDYSVNGSLDKFEKIFGSYNLRLIAAQSSVIAIGALGMTMIIISGGIDLSPGSSMALSTVIIAMCLQSASLSPILAVFAGIATGAVVGLLNGLLITRLNIVPFIVTLGMMSMARGFAKWVSNEKKIDAHETWISNLLYVNPGRDIPVWNLPTGVIILIVLAILIWLLLEYSVFGRYIYAIGSNEETAILCGIRVDRQKLFIYSLAGALVGVAAVLQFSQGNSGNPSSATGKELDLIAAVVIGGGSLSGGKGGVLGTLIGAFIIGLLRNGLVLYQISNSVQEIVIGAIIVSAAGVDQFQQRRLNR